jgi:hypothetical protein
MATSPDGITWTMRSATLGYFWYSVCWSPELRMFATVAGGGIGGGEQWIGTSKVAATLHFSARANESSALTFSSSAGPTGAATTVQGWLRVNVNGSDRFIPYW